MDGRLLLEERGRQEDNDSSTHSASRRSSSSSSSGSFRDTVLSASTGKSSHAKSNVSKLSRDSNGSSSNKSWTSSEGTSQTGTSSAAAEEDKTPRKSKQPCICQGKYSPGDLMLRRSVLHSLLPGGDATLREGHSVEFPAHNGTLLRVTATGSVNRPFEIRDAFNCTGIASATKGANSMRSGHSCIPCYNAWISNKKPKVQ